MYLKYIKYINKNTLPNSVMYLKYINKKYKKCKVYNFCFFVQWYNCDCSFCVHYAICPVPILHPFGCHVPFR